MRFFTTIAFFFAILNAQGTQNISGKVTDLDGQFTLPGVSVVAYLNDSVLIQSTTTDDQGNYLLKDLEIGRYQLKFTLYSYKDVTRYELELSSGKELVVDIQLQENITEMDDVVITAEEEAGKSSNEMATVSARSFDVEETRRYAGTRNDPARMAQNYAGVGGSDDSRNDIVVRGNTPMGVIYRLNGIDIPNPNHFAVPGSGGGPVSIINEKTLGQSNFYTGAFPAEYGNALAGVFDLNARPGNINQYEGTIQLGVLGLEGLVEGPINREKRSSFLATYRYSTLSLIQLIGLNIGTSAVPKYQDFALQLNFPTKKGGMWSFTAIGGASGNDIYVSKEEEPTEDLYTNHERDQFFRTGMGVGIFNFKKALSKKTFMSLSFGGSAELQKSHHQTVYRRLIDNKYTVDSLKDKLHYDFDVYKGLLNFTLNHKINRKNTVKWGLNGAYEHYSFQDSILIDSSQLWDRRLNASGQGILLQPFVMFKHRFTENFSMNIGWHGQYSSINNDLSLLEPRFGLEWSVHPKHTLTAGGGLHSQIAPNYVMQAQKRYATNYVQPNNQLKFSKAVHAIIGHNWSLNNYLRVKTEVYYQYLYQLPIEQTGTSYSMINQGAGFDRFFPDSLVNRGFGRNYGIELTVEKFFHKKYYFLISASLFNSEYQGSDNVWRRTDFNGQWITNFVGGKEFVLGKKSRLNLGLKLVLAGGKPTSPVNEQATINTGDIVFEDATKNSLTIQNYTRFDVKISYKYNANKFLFEAGMDLLNVLGTQNILQFTYNRNYTSNQNIIIPEYQLGFLPIIYFKFEF